MLLAEPTPEVRTELQNVVEIGESSSNLLMQTLGKNLKEHMEKGDVMGALKFCSDEAYSLTTQTNTKLTQGAVVKRISLKYRNPANAPKENEVKILESLESLKALNVVVPEYLVEKVDTKTYKYYKPLVITEACLKCHGDISKDIDLKREVAKVYPLDQAVDYKLGDLRGAVVVTITHE
jgi:hypothetical protein